MIKVDSANVLGPELKLVFKFKSDVQDQNGEPKTLGTLDPGDIVNIVSFNPSFTGKGYIAL